ncbi:MAG: hypothetical protein LBQ31_06655, partial [Bacteroidales bacterium]|nr:hypothetical protein [Bacteroidales bacterium]
STSVAQRHQGAIRERKGVFHSGGVGTDTFDQSFELDFGSNRRQAVLPSNRANDTFLGRGVGF